MTLLKEDLEAFHTLDDFCCYHGLHYQLEGGSVACRGFCLSVRGDSSTSGIENWHIKHASKLNDCIAYVLAFYIPVNYLDSWKASFTGSYEDLLNKVEALRNDNT